MINRKYNPFYKRISETQIVRNGTSLIGLNKIQSEEFPLICIILNSPFIPIFKNYYTFKYNLGDFIKNIKSNKLSKNGSHTGRSILTGYNYIYAYNRWNIPKILFTLAIEKQYVKKHSENGSYCFTFQLDKLKAYIDEDAWLECDLKSYLKKFKDEYLPFIHDKLELVCRGNLLEYFTIHGK